MYNRIIKRISAGLMAMSCVFSIIGATIPSISASAAMTTENAAFPSADEVVAEAATLLGSPYGWGFKGYTGVYYQGSYSPLSLDYVRQQGVDCSGLIYYTLAHLGYSTSGFSWNNPVPVDTAHWLSVNDNCTITYNGGTSQINVEKKNIPYKERPYWECADGSTITPGSVVIADNLDGEDHSWIYIGEFNNRDEVIAYLRKIGVNESYINSNTVGDGSGDGGTHWRIESNGSQGCVINNKTDGKKATALNMSAFRITKRDVTFEISKYNTDGNLVGKSTVDNSSAVYGIYSDKECTKSVGTITIGADGRGAISLPSGTYYAKEIKAPTGYDLDTTVYTITPGSTNVTEKYKFGSIKINKTAEDGVVADREFKVSWTEDGKGKSKTAKTDNSGNASFSNLKVYDMNSGKPISYNVSEINVDTKYVTPKAYDITLTDGNADLSVDVKFENKLKKFTAEVVKKDVESVTAQGDATLAGATYGLYHDGERIATYTTDENGHFITDEFPCGNYTLQELTPSQGYMLNDEIYKVGAEPQNYEIEINPIALEVTEDVVKGKVSIIKHSDDNDNTVENLESGAEFEVYLKSAGGYDKAKETERDYLITDGKGYAETKELPYGTYTVHQTKTVNDAAFVDDFDVNIIENHRTYEYILNNKPFRSYIHVTKIDAETGKVIPYEGAGFKIYDGNGKLVNLGTDILYTNNEGYLITPDSLKYGEYTLVEVQAPMGYVLDSTPVPFTVNDDNADEEDAVNIIKVTKADSAQKGRISVSKRGDIFQSVTAMSSAYENKDGEYMESPTKYTPVFEESGLSGAEFEVIAAEDIYTADGSLRAEKDEVVADIITDADGNAVTEPLYLGKYIVREKTAPYGYILNSEAKEVELTYAGQEVAITDAIKNTFYNDYQGVNISLAKFMEHDEFFDIGTNNEYKSVIFGLYAAENITAADGTVIPKDGFIAQVSLNENMKATIAEKLPFAKYYVQEIATDERYMLHGEKYLVNFEYMGQEQTTVYIDCGTFINDIKRGSVSGKKVNENDDPLENALFGLFSADETEFTVENAYLTDESDEDGNFSFTDIPYGKYIVKEIAAPTGYILSDDQYPVTISENDDIVEITAENKAITVSISKKDIYGSELEDASIQLIDENGDIIDEWISDSENHIITNIPAGGYTLKEVAAPDGYIIATDISFTIDEYGNVTVDGVEAIAETENGIPCVTMIDNTTIIKISKQDMTTGTELAGAKLQVIDKDGNVIEEWVSTNEPHYIEAKLIAGETYTLREITAPDGYNTAEDIEFTVNTDGSVTEVVMKDSKIITTTPTVSTGDTGKSPLGYILLFIGLVIVNVLLFTRKKKEEPSDDYAELCPDYVEGENE